MRMSYKSFKLVNKKAALHEDTNDKEYLNKFDECLESLRQVRNLFLEKDLSDRDKMIVADALKDCIGELKGTIVFLRD